MPHKLRVDLDPRRVGTSELEAFLDMFVEAAQAAAADTAASMAAAYPTSEQADLAANLLLQATAAKQSFGTKRFSAISAYRPISTLNATSSSAAAAGGSGRSRSPPLAAERTGVSAQGFGLNTDVARSQTSGWSSDDRGGRAPPRAPPVAASRADHGRRMVQAAMGARTPASSAGGALPAHLPSGRGDDNGRSPSRAPHSGRAFPGPRANARPELGPAPAHRAPAAVIHISTPFAIQPLHATGRGAGFRNIGNTCYMAAVLAALMGLLTFVNDLLDEQVFRRLRPHLPGGGAAGEGSVYAAFWALATEHGQQRRRALGAAGGGRRGDEAAVPVTPRKLKEALAKRAPRFANNAQQDASEFFSLAVDALAEEMRLADAHARGMAAPLPDDPPPALAVNLNFGGELVKRMRCKRCEHAWTRTEGFCAFSLQLPAHSTGAPSTVQQLVEAHFAPTDIEVRCFLTPGHITPRPRPSWPYLLEPGPSLGPSLIRILKCAQAPHPSLALQVTCEQCSGTHATLTHRLIRLPRLLPIHLMRFDFSGRAIVKRSDPVTPCHRLSLAFLIDPADVAPPPPLRRAGATSAHTEGATARGAPQLAPDKARTPATTRAPDASKKRSLQHSLEGGGARADASPPLGPPPTSAIAAAAPPRGGTGWRGAARGSRVPAVSASAAAQPLGRSRGGARGVRGGGRPSSRAEEEEMVQRAIAESLAHSKAVGSASPPAPRRRPVDISVDEVDLSVDEAPEADVISLDDIDDSQLVLLDETSPQAVRTAAGGGSQDAAGSGHSAPPPKRPRVDLEAPELTRDADPFSLPSSSDDSWIELTPPMPSPVATPPDVPLPASELSEDAAIAAAIAASLADSQGDDTGAVHDAVAHPDAEAEIEREPRAAEPALAAKTGAAGSGLCGSEVMDLDALFLEEQHQPDHALALNAAGAVVSGAPAGRLPRAATSYSLQSVVWHKGAAAAFGHYLADVRVPHEHMTDRGWERCAARGPLGELGVDGCWVSCDNTVD